MCNTDRGHLVTEIMALQQQLPVAQFTFDDLKVMNIKHLIELLTELEDSINGG